MIYEYALEPSLVVDWALESDGRCVGQFGLDHRRLVSDFPRDWRGWVYADLLARYGNDYGCPEVANTLPLLDAFLQILADHMVLRQIRLRHEAVWLDEAIKEHSERPFHAIFAREMADIPNADVITEKNLGDVRDKHWWLPTIKTTPKSAVDIAVQIRPLLQAASQIVIVDPYFDASKARFRETFAEIIRQAEAQPRAVSSRPVISLITGVERAFKENGRWANEGGREKRREDEARVANEIIRQARFHLAKHVANGLTVKVSVLKNPDHGDRLHNRFVLTDVGGVIVPYGLDGNERDDEHGVKDDLTFMPEGMYSERWKQYAEGKGVELVRGPEELLGAGQ